MSQYQEIDYPEDPLCPSWQQQHERLQKAEVNLKPDGPRTPPYKRNQVDSERADRAARSRREILFSRTTSYADTVLVRNIDFNRPDIADAAGKVRYTDPPPPPAGEEASVREGGSLEPQEEVDLDEKLMLRQREMAEAEKKKEREKEEQRERERKAAIEKEKEQQRLKQLELDLSSRKALTLQHQGFERTPTPTEDKERSPNSRAPTSQPKSSKAPEPLNIAAVNGTYSRSDNPPPPHTAIPTMDSTSSKPTRKFSLPANLDRDNTLPKSLDAHLRSPPNSSDCLPAIHTVPGSPPPGMPFNNHALSPQQNQKLPGIESILLEIAEKTASENRQRERNLSLSSQPALSGPSPTFVPTSGATVPFPPFNPGPTPPDSATSSRDFGSAGPGTSKYSAYPGAASSPLYSTFFPHRRTSESNPALHAVGAVPESYASPRDVFSHGSPRDTFSHTSPRHPFSPGQTTSTNMTTPSDTGSGRVNGVNMNSKVTLPPPVGMPTPTPMSVTTPLSVATSPAAHHGPPALQSPVTQQSPVTLQTFGGDRSGSVYSSEKSPPARPSVPSLPPVAIPKQQPVISTAPAHSPTGYKCEFQGCSAAAFQTQYLLNSHATVHSHSRPHYCPVPGCSRSSTGQGFKRKNEMKRHGLVHQSPGYVCPFCPDRVHKYPRPDNLQRHVRVHHSNVTPGDARLREVLEKKGADGMSHSGGGRGRERKRRAAS